MNYLTHSNELLILDGNRWMHVLQINKRVMIMYSRPLPNVTLPTYHPSILLATYKKVHVGLESILADFRREAGLTPDRLPVYHSANTENQSRSHSHVLQTEFTSEPNRPVFGLGGSWSTPRELTQQRTCKLHTDRSCQA